MSDSPDKPVKKAIPTPRYNHEPIIMTPIPAHEDAKKPGDFHFGFVHESDQEICWIAVPSDKLICGWVYAGVKIARDKQESGWIFNGDRKAPSFLPSVHVKGHWHGYIKSGMLIEA